MKLPAVKQKKMTVEDVLLPSLPPDVGTLCMYDVHVCVYMFKEKSDLLFLTLAVLIANPKKLLHTVANPARGLLIREKRTKEKIWQRTPPHAAHSEK